MGDVLKLTTIAGTELFRVDDSGNVTAAGTISTTGTDDFGASGIKADVIAESTAAAGVTVDGLLLKDGFVVATDNQGVKLGTGTDDTLTHNGTNTLWTHTTGNLIIDNQLVTGAIYMDLGTDTSATSWGVRNNTGAVMWAVSPSSAAAGTLQGVDNSALVLGTGADDTVSHDGTSTLWAHTTGSLVIDNTDVNDPTVFRLGTDTSATGVQVRNNSDVVKFEVKGDGTVWVNGGTLDMSTGASDILLPDDNATALRIREKTNSRDYIIIDTGNASESITFGDAAVNPTFSFVGSGTFAFGTGALTLPAAMITVPDGGEMVFLGAGTGTGDVVQRVGATASEAFRLVVYDATVSPAAVETNLINLPAGSMIVSVQANVQAALTGGGTTVTWSIGTTGDPDKYGSAGFNSITGAAAADALTQNSKSTWFGDGSHAMSLSAAAEQLVLTGAATGGAADGNTALTVGSVRVRVIYWQLQALDNA